MRIFIFFIISLFTLQTYSQIAVVKGRVIDAQSKRPIAEAVISLGSDDVTSTVSDSNGRFEISISEYKRETIYITKNGYELYEKKLSFKPEETRNMLFEIKSLSKQIKEAKITVKKKIKTSKTETTTQIEVNDKQSNPSGNVENSLKYQAMGVGGNNELGSQFSVRGGSFDENLIYVNDFEIYRPLLIRNAQQEGLSFANSKLISNMKFSSGGFEAKYGDKLSSVLDIEYKKPKKFAGSIEAGLLGASGHIEGSIFKEKLKFLTGVRYRNNSYLLGSQEVKGSYTPQFLDVQSDIHFEPSKKLDIEALTCMSSNRFSIVPSDRETNFGLANFALTYRVNYSGQEVDKYLNWMQGLSIGYKPTENLKIKLNSAYYQVNEKQYFDITGLYGIGEIESDVNSSNYQGFKSIIGSGIFHNWGRENYQATMMHGGITVNALIGNQNLKLGAKVKNEEFNVGLNSWDRLDSAGYNIPSYGNRIEVLNPIHAEYLLKGQRYEGYAQDKWTIPLTDSSSISIVGGLRANYWSVNKEFFLSPRAQIFYHPKPNTSIYTAIGSYNQAPFLRELIDEKGILHTNVKSQKSIHYILGFDKIFKLLKRPFKFTAEGYYKQMWDINSYQYNNVLVRYAAKNNVTAYAAGIDLRLQGEFVKDAESWVNIGLLQTKEYDPSAIFMKYRDTLGREYFDKQYTNGKFKDSFLWERGWIQRPNNQFLMVNIFFQDYIPQLPQLKVSLSLTLASGLPFGPPNNEPLRNSFNLLAYKRIDIGFSYRCFDAEKSEKPKSFLKSIWATLDIFNAVDFYNQVSMNWIQDYTGGQFAVPNYLTGRRFNLRLQANF